MVIKLTFALPKGRILFEIIPLLNIIGLNIKSFNNRKLIFPTNISILRVIIVRSSDVALYVKYGVADIGIVGKDILLEYGNLGLYEFLNLNVGICRLSISSKKKFNFQYFLKKKKNLIISTKYINITKRYFLNKNLNINLIKLNGSIELSPLIGLSDIIIDLVSTGITLKSNKLIEIKSILKIYSILIVNKSFLKLKYNIIFPILNFFKNLINNKWKLK